MKISSFLYAAAFLAVALVVSGSAQAAPSAETFVKKAAVANLFEIQSSQLALQKSQNKQVKNFAQMMIDDHTKAGDQLKSTLSAANIDSSTVPTTLDAKHEKIEDKLNSAPAGKFDKDYIKAQSQAHIETIVLFKSYADNGDNAALKSFALQTLPTLEKHKGEVDALMASGMSMGSSNAGMNDMGTKAGALPGTR
jgi:putative membrane protein